MKPLLLLFWKKILKNKMNWFIGVFLIAIVGVTYYFNSQAAYSRNLAVVLEQSIVKNEARVASNEQVLTQLDRNSEEYEYANQNLVEFKKRLQEDKDILELLQQQKWNEAYTLQWQREEHNYRIVQADSHVTPELVKAIDKQRRVYQALATMNREQHSLEYPTYGIDSVLWVLQYIVPFLFSLCVLFSLTQLYAERFKGLIDTRKLLPISLFRYSSTSLLVGLGHAGLLLFMLCGVALLIGSVVVGIGTWDYPYPLYDCYLQTHILKPLYYIVLPSLTLAVLSLVPLVELVYLLTMLIKNRMTTLLVSVLIVLGNVLSVSLIQPLFSVAHWLPFTYLRGVDVVNGELSQLTGNPAITFSSGVLTTLVISMGLWLVMIFIEKSRDKR